MGGSHNKGTLNWGPYNKDPTILGTIFGSSIFGNPQTEGHMKPPREPELGFGLTEDASFFFGPRYEICMHGGSKYLTNRPREPNTP